MRSTFSPYKDAGFRSEAESSFAITAPPKPAKATRGRPMGRYVVPGEAFTDAKGRRYVKENGTIRRLKEGESVTPSADLTAVKKSVYFRTRT